MKTMKKLASAALALVMALCLTVPAFAVEPQTGSITVTNAVPGQTYTLYKLFDLAYGGAADENKDAPHTYSILSNSPWYGFVSGEGTGAGYVTLTASTEEVKDAEGNALTKYYVTWKAATDAETAQAFAKLALAYAKENNIGNQGTTVADPAAEGETTPEVKFEGLELGYYLIDSSLGALCTLNSTNFNARVTEKNEKPTDTKTSDMPENSKVGTDISYTITINAKKGAEAYVVHDTMSASLTFKPNSLVVTATPVVPEGEIATPVTLTKDTHYTLAENVEHHDDKENPEEVTSTCTFELTLKQDYLDTLAGNTTIVITYKATINANAVIGKDPITNKEILSYGDGNKTVETPGTQTEDKLYEFDIVKTNSDERGREVLDGAEFELYDVAEGGEAITLVYIEDAENGNYYRPATAEEKADTTVTKTTTIQAGVTTIKGLGAGTYYLEETKAPEGYNKLRDRQMVALSADLKATVEDGKYKENVADDPATADVDETFTNSGVRVINRTGAELPETGGIGTTIFYIVGGLLAVGAGVLLVTKKKMGADEE